MRDGDLMYKNCGSASSGQPLSALVIPCWPLPARVPSPAPSELVDRQRLFLFLFLMSLKGITCIYWLASASASAKCCCVGEHLQRSAQRANFLQACQSCATKTHAAIAACAWCRPPPPPPRVTHIHVLEPSRRSSFMGGAAPSNGKMGPR